MRLIYLPVIFFGISFNGFASSDIPDGSYAAHKPVSKNFGNYPIGYDVKGIIVTKFKCPEPKKKDTTQPIQFNRTPLPEIKEVENEEAERTYYDPLVGTIRLDKPFFDEDEK